MAEEFDELTADGNQDEEIIQIPQVELDLKEQIKEKAKAVLDE